MPDSKDSLGDLNENQGETEEKAVGDLNENQGETEEKAVEDLNENQGETEEKAVGDLNENQGETEEKAVEDLHLRKKTVRTTFRARNFVKKQNREKNRENSIKVSNLPMETQPVDLMDIAKCFGPTKKVFVARYKDTGLCKGFGYINFRVKKHAADAIKELNGYTYGNHILHVDWSISEAPSEVDQLLASKLDESPACMLLDQSSISEPDKLLISEPDKLLMSEPDKLLISEPDKLLISEPDKLLISEPDKLLISEPDKLTLHQLDLSTD